MTHILELNPSTGSAVPGFLQYNCLATRNPDELTHNIDSQVSASHISFQSCTVYGYSQTGSQKSSHLRHHPVQSIHWEAPSLVDRDSGRFL